MRLVRTAMPRQMYRGRTVVIGVRQRVIEALMYRAICVLLTPVKINGYPIYKTLIKINKNYHLGKKLTKYYTHIHAQSIHKSLSNYIQETI